MMMPVLIEPFTTRIIRSISQPSKLFMTILDGKHKIGLCSTSRITFQILSTEKKTLMAHTSLWLCVSPSKPIPEAQ